MSVCRRITARVTSRLGASYQANQLVFDAQYKARISARIDVLPQSSLDDDYAFARDTLLPFEIGKVILDIATTTSDIAIVLERGLADEALAQSAVSLGFSTGAQDSVEPSDDFAREVGYSRAYSDGLSASESAAITAGKPLGDSVNGSDAVQTVGVGKATFDSAVTNDATAFDSAKVLADTAVSIDAPALTSNKPQTDTATTEDEFARVVEFNRSEADTTTTADAQTMTSGKALSDTSTTGDDLSRIVGYTRSYADTAVSIDAPALTANKPTSDTATTGDQQNLTPGLIKADTATTTDTQTMTSGKALTDTTTTADGLSRIVGYTRSYADTATTADTQTLTSAKPLTDTAITIDAVGLTPTMLKLDTALTSAHIIGKSVGKGVTDTATTSDSLTYIYAVGRVVNDSSVADDSGSLTLTTYWDDNSVWDDTGVWYDSVNRTI